jgi:hypothetical protein
VLYAYSSIRSVTSYPSERMRVIDGVSTSSFTASACLAPDCATAVSAATSGRHTLHSGCPWSFTPKSLRLAASTKDRASACRESPVSTGADEDSGIEQYIFLFNRWHLSSLQIRVLPTLAAASKTKPARW